MECNIVLHIQRLNTKKVARESHHLNCIAKNSYCNVPVRFRFVPIYYNHLSRHQSLYLYHKCNTTLKTTVAGKTIQIHFIPP